MKPSEKYKTGNGDAEADKTWRRKREKPSRIDKGIIEWILEE